MPKVNIDTGAVAKLNAFATKALKMAADATLTDIISAQVIPFDVGTMQNDQTFTDTVNARHGKVSIVTSAAQAGRLYFHPEYDFQTVNNPNARGGWFDDWISGAKQDFAKDAFAKFLSDMMGG